ncbi:MAG TPA: hypothetical protein VF493_16955 [Terriglobales bacterium]
MAPSGSTPPPLSLTTCWDKGKWHFDAASFPAHLPRSAGWNHIVAALRFLEERGQLTAAGKRELAQADEEISLLPEQIKAAARAFLDQSYEGYLSASEGYDSPPPLHVLEAAWTEYTGNYDISKRPQPNGYQRLLLDHAHDRTADALLRALDRVPGLEARLRTTISDVPLADRPLMEAALACHEKDPVTVAYSWPQPHLLLQVLRCLDPRRHALHRLRAALILEDRLGKSAHESPHLEALVYAVNLGAAPEAETAWHTLSPGEQRRLTEAVHSLFAAGADIHLALCAMRTVGDQQSLTLIDQSIGHPAEGTTESSGGHKEPSWESIRREAREAITRRLSRG